MAPKKPTSKAKKKPIKKGSLTLESGGAGTQGVNPATEVSQVVELPSELKRLRLPVILSPSEVELVLRCHRRHVLGDIFRHHRPIV